MLRTIENKAIEVVSKLHCPQRLKFNMDKTQHSSMKHRRVITGLVLGSDGTITIGRSRKREIRSFIHKWSDLDDLEKNRLRGLISFARGVEVGFIDKLIIKYGHKLIKKILSTEEEF